jgi:hypothetical protein
MLSRDIGFPMAGEWFVNRRGLRVLNAYLRYRPHQ